MNYSNILIYPLTQKLAVLPKLNIKAYLKLFLISGFLFIIFFLVLCIYQISAVISAGYQIESHKDRIEKLTNENKILNINSIKINSLENIDSKIRELGFEKIDKIHYIKILSDSVVKAAKKIE